LAAAQARKEKNAMTTDFTANKPSVDSELERTLNGIGIPPRPIIIDRITQEMRKDEPNFNYLGQLITADVSLAASLIKMANSPYFGLQGRARSVNDAVLMLGLKVTSRAIAGLSLRRAFPASPQLERFWSASAQTAALSGWLVSALEIPGLRADEAYTFGLFRDCGIPVLQRRFSNYEQTLVRANDELEQPFTHVEIEQYSTDHATIGCLLAQNWWLPEEICLAIRHHHDMQVINAIETSLPATSLQMIAVSQTSEYLLQLITGLSHTCEWTKLGASCLRLLNITQVELPGLCKKAVEVLETVE
jgi:HD-like signal output (HDOD) protein